jgi:hypothetical protein
VAWLRFLGTAIRTPDAPEERAHVVHAIYERVTVGGPEIG